MQHCVLIGQSPGSSQAIKPPLFCAWHSFPPALARQVKVSPPAQHTLVLSGQLTPPQLIVGETHVPEASHSSGPPVVTGHGVRAAFVVEVQAVTVLHTPKEAQRLVVIGP